MIADCDFKEFESLLLFIELESKCSDVHLGALPICVEVGLEEHPCTNIERAPLYVKLLKDLDGSLVAVCSHDVL